jgi:ketosteroid isomerase-like protein
VHEQIVEQLRDGYEAFNRGDIQAVTLLLDPEIEVIERDEAPERNVFKGREDVMAGFHALRDDFDDYRFEPREFITEPEHVIVVLRQSGRGRISGAQVEGEMVHAWKVEDERAVAVRGFSSLDDALAAVRGSGA